MTLWCNGKLMADDAPLAGASDRGLLLGDGLFETVKIVDQQPLFLTEHLCRMAVAAQELALPVNRKALRSGLSELLADAAAAGHPVGSARITVSRGGGPRGLSPIPMSEQRPLALITIAPPAPIGGMGGTLDRLVMAPFIRAAASPSSRMKTLSYADNLAAKAWAEDQNAADAVFVNEHGHVACTTMANLFVKTDRGFATPPLSAGVLPGIVRQTLLKVAPHHGIKIEVRTLSVGDLWGQAIYRTNSLMGVKPAWLHHGAGAHPPSGPMDTTLADLYQAAEQDEERA